MRAAIIPYVSSSRDNLDQLSRIASGVRVTIPAIESLEALERYLRDEEPDAILTDSQLMDGDWRDVMELCVGRSHRIPVVVTAQTDSASLWAEVADAGVQDLLARPFYPAEVRQCLVMLKETQNQEQLAEATL